ncbi:Uu.00g040360.m01.CDS01 [Anthostomella pinea]|uniref:Uu.00g040360.m01.CDS01 n=1 Tax=Anthostomella pinea TaxID=933095 RepID=A0AAI8YE23_9PEZI|nr:Uu.00g040360.m01.CDS01 [Anthostomella pinea]
MATDTPSNDGLKNGQQGAREGLLGACSKLVAELSHPSETMLALLWSQPTHLSIIRTGVEMKLFRAMIDVEPAGETPTEIASKCEPQAEPLLVGRMLRHLAAMGTVRGTGPDTFAPTPTSNAFAEPAYEDSVLFIVDDFQPALNGMPSYFRQNGFKCPDSGVDCQFQHAFDCKGLHLFEYFQQRDPEMGRRFASVMEAWSKGRPRWFDSEYYPVKERLISGADNSAPFLVDVGGGTGHDIEGLKQAFGADIPGKLVLQDRHEIVELAQLDSSIEKMSHDFLTEQPVKGARAYYLHSIIQDWNDEVNSQILRAIVPAMKRGYSKILINDFVVPNQGAHWAQTCLDWELMASLGARHRTEAGHANKGTYVEYPDRFGATYAATLQAVYAGIPDYTVPTGVLRCYSRITRQNKELLVTIGIIAAAHCEGMLADLVVDMAESGAIDGLQTVVNTGKSVY